jgi:hypothetical protein
MTSPSSLADEIDRALDTLCRISVALVAQGADWDLRRQVLVAGTALLRAKRVLQQQECRRAA